MSGRIPDWVLERHLVGERPKGFTEADLAADPTVPERLERMRAGNEEILKRHPPPVVAANVRARAEARNAELRPVMVRLVPAAIAAVLLVVVAPVVVRQMVQPGGPDLLTKGMEPHLEVLRKGPNGSEALAPGAAAQPGNVIQLRVIGAGAAYGVVVAMDGTGSAELLTPAALQLPRSGSLALPDALELDAKGPYERFILVTSDGTFEAADVLTAARKLGPDRSAPLELPSGLKQSSFLIVKGP